MNASDKGGSMKNPILTVLLLIGSSAFAMDHSAHSNHDRPATHGMAVVGHNKVYLSHLPMFHSPHDYQVILEVEFDTRAKNIYDQSVTNPSELYTVAPEDFILPDMTKAGNTFQATLFKGHFERDGVAIAENVTVKITKVLYFKKFQPGASNPAQAQYILFGNESEQFMAHVITAKPDFDQILKLKSDATLAAVLALKESVIATIQDQKNQDPLVVPASKQAVFNEEPTTLNLGVESEIYLENGDLSM
jgi:hypothetical protein